MRHRTRAALGTGATTLAVAIGCGSPARTAAPPGVVVFNDNGAWSWFEDERAVIDAASGTLLVSSVANGHGTGGAVRDGNVEVVAYDLAAGDAGRTVLHANLEADDHDSAALHVRRDGRYVAAYSRHDSDPVTRWRVSDGPGTAATWGPEQTIDNGAGTTYSNLVADGTRLHNFVRGAGWDPHFLVSEDDGSTWTPGGRLLEGPGRPYVRYAAGRDGEIHLLASEQHPRDVATSIHHGVMTGGRLLRSDGRVVDDDVHDEVAAAPSDLTTVLVGDATRRAWPVDLQVGADGLSYVVFSVRSTPSGSPPEEGSEHRYHYGRFDGGTWHVHEMARAGGELYAAEPDYTGLAALDPHDASRVVISTDVDPLTGAPLISAGDGRRHHELFEGTTVDGGGTWSWTALTANSTVDNIRPIIPVADSSRRVLLWLRGSYTTYAEYDLDVVGIVWDLAGAESTSVTTGRHVAWRNDSRDGADGARLDGARADRARRGVRRPRACRRGPPVVGRGDVDLPGDVAA